MGSYKYDKANTKFFGMKLDYETMISSFFYEPEYAGPLLLELKDKVSNDDLTGHSDSVAFVPAAQSAQAEAVEALMALGYPSNEAAKAVAAVGAQADKTNDIVVLALKKLGGGL